MEQVQIGNKTLNLLELDESNEDSQEKENKGIFVSKFISIFCVFIIIFILIPKFNFLNTTPKVGTLITQDIVSDYDVLVKDQDATNFKIDSSLSKLGVFLDYDPLAYQRLIEKINTAFDKFSKRNQELLDQKRLFAEEKLKLTQGYVDNKVALGLIKREKKIIQEYIASLKSSEEQNTYQILYGEQKFQNLESQKDISAKKEESIHLNLAELQKKDKDFEANFRNNQENNLALLFQELDLNFDQAVVQFLQESPDYSFLKNRIVDLLRFFDRSYIISSKEILKSNANNKNIQVFNLETNNFLANPSQTQFVNLEEARELLNKYIEEISPENSSTKLNRFALILASKLLVATSFENKQKLEDRRKEVINEGSTVFRNIKKGEILAEKGKSITAEGVNLIEGYFSAINQGKGILYTLSIGVVSLLVIIIIFVSLKLYRGLTAFFYENFVILLTSLAVNLIIIYSVKEIFELLATHYQFFSLSSYIYALPVVLSVMLCGALTNFRINIPNVFLSALCITLYLEENLYFFLFCWLSSSVACLTLTSLNTRFDLFKKGFIVAIANTLILFFIEILSSKGLPPDLLASVISAFMGGILATFFSVILLPLLEQIFGVSTQLKLLELSNLNHPLLKYLQNRAPGTYQHAIIVGSLAESGAQKIGANLLLAKIGAYYHDIGKAIEPQYFNENQKDLTPSIHDKMSPKESAKKIINHVVYGVQMAKKFKLGKRMVDIITNHHGDATIQFFYEKALKKNSDKKISETDFKYPMSLPKDLETAIVMLADNSEVSVRSLKKPNKTNVTRTVGQVFQNIIDNGKLDASNINIVQLRKLKTTFIDILISLHHDRSLGKI